MTAKIVEAANVLVEMSSSTGEEFEAFRKRIKDIEHECDEITHSLSTKLNKSFITPFDREDIYALSVALDDVCDYIDAGARAMRMYDIREFTGYARELVEIIQKLAAEINEAVGTLKKPQYMGAHLVEIHRLENEADDAYFRGIAELFKEETDAIHIVRWKEVYEILENATDRCESVANIIESIVLKHN
jgi:hypothetical protein